MPNRRNSSSSSKMGKRSRELASLSASARVPKKNKQVAEGENLEVEEDMELGAESSSPNSHRGNSNRTAERAKDELNCKLLGEPVPLEEAKQRWPHRYDQQKSAAQCKPSNDDDDDDKLIEAQAHYLQCEVDGKLYDLNDHAHVNAGEKGELDYIGKIVEIFQAIDGMPYFTAQWFYRAEDTVIKRSTDMTERKRVFLSEDKNDNSLDCLVDKLTIVCIKPNVDLKVKTASIPKCDYYYDMSYSMAYSTFANLAPGSSSESISTISSEVDVDEETETEGKSTVSEMSLLDLYSGCGAMSTGLCLGANMYGVNLVTRWAVDLNPYACESLALNHPGTQVRNESVEDFLLLLIEWKRLCESFSLIKSQDPCAQQIPQTEKCNDILDTDDGDEGDDVSEVFEVERVLAICFGDPKENGERGLHFKVCWKGYGPNEDSWEPADGLGNCEESIKKFVVNGYNANILPLPGAVEVICGGPPCQGVSGFNRFRNKEKPLDDEKNKQLKVFMDVVEYLKPKYVLMENVVDIIKFAGGFLGRYAVGRLVHMNYQARMGMMAAGSYGLPQFRMRVFIWGAQPSETLPQYPLPTHDLVLRGVIPREFERNTVAYDEGQKVEFQDKLFLGDAISDLPEITNKEAHDEISYVSPPQTDFQRFIRLKREAMLGASTEDISVLTPVLYDHRPLELNDDDFQRVCRIPKKKGANFRDLPGVIVRPDNKVEFDPNVKRVYLKSGKPLVPDYAMSFVRGTSSKPFGRLWWDETVPTVVTRAEPHNQVILHPLQDRVLTIRENARIQGFPDYYQLKGPVKERYIQVGNAVAIPVARALGYALGMASEGFSSSEPLFTLPAGFPAIREQQPSDTVEENM